MTAAAVKNVHLTFPQFLRNPERRKLMLLHHHFTAKFSLRKKWKKQLLKNNIDNLIKQSYYFFVILKIFDGEIKDYTFFREASVGVRC
jgi:hypothetical protein